MAEKKALSGIHIYQSQAQYESDLQNLKNDELSLVPQEEEYATKEEVAELREMVENLQKILAEKGG